MTPALAAAIASSAGGCGDDSSQWDPASCGIQRAQSFAEAPSSQQAHAGPQTPRGRLMSWTPAPTAEGEESPLPKLQPRNPSRELDADFLRALHEALVSACCGMRDAGTHLSSPISFAARPWLPATEPGADFHAEDSLSAPCVPPLLPAQPSAAAEAAAPAAAGGAADVAPRTPAPQCGLSQAMAYGCDLRWMLATFKEKTAIIYAALLNRATICFVGHGQAGAVGRAVLSCVHLVAPLRLAPTELVPYFTVSDASKIERLGFCVAGSTNPFYEDPARNKWAALICHVGQGTVSVNSKQQAAPPGELRRFVQHLLQGVQEGRPEVWVRCFFQWQTARIAARDGTAPEDVPCPLKGHSPVTEPELCAAAERCERFISCYTKCHEVNKAKLAIHSDWFATMREVLSPVADRSEQLQKDFYGQLVSFPVAEVSVLDDASFWSCLSRTERAFLAQLAHEEEKTRLLIKQLRGRLYLLLDLLNCRNSKALRDADNRGFCDTFNLPEFQLYNLPQQVLLHSASCALALAVCEGLDDSSEPVRTTGRLWVSKNYFAFKAGWLSRRKAKDKAHHVEVIPFDIVRSVLRTPPDCSVMSDGLKVSLPGVMLYVGHLHDTFRTAALLQTLVEKQRCVQRMCGSADPVIAVPSPRHEQDDALSVTRRIVVPCGLYLRERSVREEIWELQRNYPIVGWSGKLLPTDPPGWCDWSGHRELRMDAAELPAGWRWVGEWEPNGMPESGGPPGSWEYSTDYKPGGWKEEAKKGKLDLCRRRCWVRERVVVFDRSGAPLPPLPPDPSGAAPSSPAAAAAAAAATADRAAALEYEAQELRAEQTRLRQELNPKHRGRLVELKDGIARLEAQVRRLRQLQEQQLPTGVRPLAAGAEQTDAMAAVAWSPHYSPELAERLDPSAFSPTALQGRYDVNTLSLADFDSVSGWLNPLHSSAEAPGCGSSEVAAGLGCRAQLLQAEDELIAESQGLLKLRTKGGLSPSRIRDDFRDFRAQVRQDMKGLGADLKMSFAGRKMEQQSFCAPEVNMSFQADDRTGSPTTGALQPSQSYVPSPTGAREGKHRHRPPPRTRGVVVLNDQERARPGGGEISPHGGSIPRSHAKVQFADTAKAAERAVSPASAPPAASGSPSPEPAADSDSPRRKSQGDALKTDTADVDWVFPLGAVVEVHSLSRHAELNGRRGTVVGHQLRWDGEQCMQVQLDTGVMVLRPKNLRSSTAGAI
eukprot:TRINITY_DN3481_c0_g2_i2.p1 TRINITY_DN3481_c0_g2~~TRINITY_DN3481_c0_g2_i2.p1  ORF type:complete len:1406 (+),score=397.93 TRINITY_DN3481_c0_g2_i2:561-4220(+)